MNSKKDQLGPRVTVSLDDYTNHVLKNLIGLRGRSKPGVAYYILRDWIRIHKDELKEMGIEPKVTHGIFYKEGVIEEDLTNDLIEGE